MSTQMTPSEKQEVRRQLANDPTLVADILNHVVELTGEAGSSPDGSDDESPFAA